VVTNMPEMTTRSGHYTALLETIGARGATKLHAYEREQLLAVWSSSIALVSGGRGQSAVRALRRCGCWRS
jgi:hypothetical protein